MKGIELDAKQFQKALEKKLADCDKNNVKFVTWTCAEVERTAKSIMRDTRVNQSVTYGRKGHHPSVEGEPPAPDTGALMQSVTHSVDVVTDNKVVGYVGSILKNPDYPKFLEFGTSKMKPRPWLSASLIKCQNWIGNLARELFIR